ncbi:MAG: murein biosynthesis integral membrane protein MurJ [Alphaproteobacteria bacterium]
MAEPDQRGDTGNDSGRDHGGDGGDGGNLARSVGTVGGLTLISRLLGYVRDIFMAVFIGAGPVGDAFTFALTLPNSFRQIFAEGAFNAAFVPTYTELQTREGKAAAARFAGQVMTLLLVILLPLSGLILWQMPAVIGFLSQGYDPAGQRFALAVLFSRLMFGYLTLISLMALCTAILNANGRFAPGPGVQIGYNVILIAALVLAVPVVGYPAHVLSVGVLGAGVFQFGLTWLLASLLVGITVVPRLPRLDRRLRGMMLLMGPGVASAAGLQISSLLNRALASDIVGAQSQLYFAERLYFLPLALIGIAFGVVILPTLSRALARGDDAGAGQTIHDGLSLAGFVAIPASVALLVMPREIIATLFQYGRFDAAASAQAGWILMALSIGLLPVILQRVLYPVFFARKDTLTPMLVTLAGVGVQVALAVTLFPVIGVFGLGLSIAIAAWLQAFAAAWLTGARGFWRPDAALMAQLARVCIAAAVMGAGLWLLRGLSAEIFVSGAAWQRVPIMAGLVLAGLTVYILMSIVMNAVPLSAMAALRRFRRRSG